MRTMTVTCGGWGTDFPGYNNISIQAAVNYAASFGGGEVLLSAGEYNLRDSVHLADGITLRGAGIGKTVLKKAASVKCTTENYCGYGHSEITVTDASIFSVGDGVYLSDENAGAFHSTQTTITMIDGNTVFLRHPLNADIAKARGGIIETLFPLVRGEGVDEATVTELTLDGNAENNGRLNGCRGGGIFLIACSNIFIEHVRVTNFNGDAISYQQCMNVRVIDSVCDFNRGHGMHPGSGTVGMLIEGCTLENNGGNGIYYCLRIHYNICRGNTIRNNGKEGISVGHRDDYVDICDNEIYGNGREGLIFRNDRIPSASGKYTAVRNNKIYGNTLTSGEGEIYVPLELTGLQMYNNKVGGEKSLVLTYALLDSYIWDNEFEGSVEIRNCASCEAFFAVAAPEIRIIDIDDIPAKEYRHLAHLSV